MRQSQWGGASRRSVLWIDLWMAVERPVRNADFHQQDSIGVAAIAIVAPGGVLRPFASASVRGEIQSRHPDDTRNRR